MVNHHGSTISGGHYTAFCKQRLGWFCFNDTLGAPLQRFPSLPAKRALPPARSRCDVTRERRYLLFYIKRPADVVSAGS